MKEYRKKGEGSVEGSNVGSKVAAPQAAHRSPGLKNLVAVSRRLKNFLPFKEVLASQAARRSPHLNHIAEIRGLENPHLHLGKIPTFQAEARTSQGLTNLRAVCQRLKNFLPFKEVPTSPAARRSPRLENLIAGICGRENPHLYLEKIPTSQAAAWRIQGLKNLVAVG